MNLDDKLKNLAGPVLVLGASGFIGANLLHRLIAVRNDVFGTVFSGDTWRLDGVPSANTVFLNLQDPVSVTSVLNRIAPRTIFDCSSFGAYSFEQDYERTHATNYLSFIRLMEAVAGMDLAAFVHAGSSSEYGLNSAAPAEDGLLLPNSHYAVSKAAASAAIAYYGKVRGVPVANLRLYSVYGPYEDSSRLFPVLCEASLRGELPVLARAEVSRDFVHVDDVVEAFANTADQMGPNIAGESFNIGSGRATTLAALADLAIESFGLKVKPRFNPAAGRAWDTDNWYSDSSKAKRLLGWSAKIGLADGLKQTRDWWQNYLSRADFKRLTKRTQERKEKNSITAVIACYRDGQAIPIMHERLVAVFERMGLDYEIIFVNDNSPDNSAEVIREISARDAHVIGITHSRNFGSQAAFRSGMELASKQAVVLMDGDLQDPPELIEAFVERWHAGADVVYGRRIKREMPLLLEVCYRAFYRIFAIMSEVPVPKDAGDFSLIDRSVVYWMLQCQERDAFLRGLRAYVGFRQEGVDYVRPERMFGVSTNNWIRNIGWAKKGIFSFSRMPLHLLTAAGGVASIATILLAITTIIIRFYDAEAVPRGVTFLSLLVMFFGSFILFGIGLLGEYIGKIFEETKARPAFIRRSLIARGEIRPADPRGKH
jgi:polyisoprenyl-phosphate glycosyltransferase